MSVYLRKAVASVCRQGVANRIGTSIYRTGASHAARCFSKIKGVQTIEWRGGALHDCIPGSSDIDLSLVVDRLTPDLLAEVRTQYRSLKRWFPALGEVFIRYPPYFDLATQWGTAFALPYLSSVIWSGKWGNVETREIPIRLQTRFSSALTHYARAIYFLGQSDSFLNQRNALKDLRKVFFYSGEEVPSFKEMNTGLLADAFFCLDRLAKQILSLPLPGSVEALKIKFDGPLLDPSQTLISKFFVKNLVNKAKATPLSVAPIPRLVCLSSEDPGECRRIIQKYSRLVKDLPQAPLLLSSAGVDLYLLGWNASERAGYRRAVPVSMRKNTEWAQLSGRHLALRLLSDAIQLINVLPESAVCREQQFSDHWTELQWILQVFRTGCVKEWETAPSIAPHSFTSLLEDSFQVVKNRALKQLHGT